jgi:hypothetical protein
MTSTLTAPAAPKAARAAPWRSRAGLAAAITGIAAVLAAPGPHRLPATPAGPVQSGPPALTGRWPSARPFPIPATLPGGLTYSPELILGPSLTAGLATSADQLHLSVAIARPSGPARILQTDVPGLASFDALTTSGGSLFWMRTHTSESGQQHTSLWTASLTGPGPPRQLAADTGTPDFGGTRYSLQAASGRLYWTGSNTGGGPATTLYSIPVTGGPVTARTIPGAWQLSAWPWLTTPPSPGSTPELLNAVTGQHAAVRAPKTRITVCGPAWCRISAGDSAQPQDTTLMHPDGSASRQIATGGTTAISDEVALEGRFEPLGGTIDPNAATPATALTLYDLRTGHTTMVDPAATEAQASGDYLWWSSGDNETRAWHGLDLRTLH